MSVDIDIESLSPKQRAAWRASPAYAEIVKWQAEEEAKEHAAAEAKLAVFAAAVVEHDAAWRNLQRLPQLLAEIDRTDELVRAAADEAGVAWRVASTRREAANVLFSLQHGNELPSDTAQLVADEAKRLQP